MSDASSRSTEAFPFDVIDLTPETVVAYRPEPASGEHPSVNDGKANRRIIVGPGDVLRISIVERYPGGIFATLGEPTASLGDQRVNGDGTIKLPFAGKIEVAGRDLRQIEAEIAKNLVNKASDPQVVVELESDRTNTVSVAGDVKNPGQISLLGGSRSVVDAINEAGGPIYPNPAAPGGLSPATGSSSSTGPANTGSGSDMNAGGPSAALTTQLVAPKVSRTPSQIRVVVRRQGQVILSDQLSNLLAGRDIAVQRDDEIVVTFNSRVVSILGAVVKAGNVPLTKPDMTLGDVLGEAAGLFDAHANVTGVFVFRSPDVRIIQNHGRIFRLDLLQPNSVFVAQQFGMQAGDVLYVVNAPLHDYDKFLEPLFKTVGIVNVMRTL